MCVCVIVTHEYFSICTHYILFDGAWGDRGRFFVVVFGCLNCNICNCIILSLLCLSKTKCEIDLIVNDDKKPTCFFLEFEV